MNELTIVQAEKEMVEAKDGLLTQEAFLTDPLGHSEYQLRHFVVAQNNPTDDTKHKQVVRELWARWGAWRQAKLDLGQAVVKLDELDMDLQEAKERRAWTPRAKRRKANAVRLIELEYDATAERIKELKLDLEHRIIRETRVLVKILSELPKPPANQDRMVIEDENWRLRAQGDSRLSLPKMHVPPMLRGK